MEPVNQSDTNSSTGTDPRPRFGREIPGPIAAVECAGLEKSFRENRRPAGAVKDSFLRRMLRRGSRITAVGGIDMRIEQGEIFGVLGPNGSGKSTLIRILATLITPDRGSARVFGFDVVRESLEVRRLINRVSVEASFFKKLSAWENLSFAAGLYGVGRREAREKSEEILRALGMKNGAIDKPLERMSRGMQQKVAIARALLTSPALLLLDEPTTGLDPVSKRQVQEFVARIREERGTTVILTTHDLEEAENLCDRIALMDRGRIAARGTAGELSEMFACEAEEYLSLRDVYFLLAAPGGEEEEEP